MNNKKALFPLTPASFWCHVRMDIFYSYENTEYLMPAFQHRFIHIPGARKNLKKIRELARYLGNIRCNIRADILDTLIVRIFLLIRPVIVHKIFLIFLERFTDIPGARKIAKISIRYLQLLVSFCCTTRFDIFSSSVAIIFLIR